MAEAKNFTMFVRPVGSKDEPWREIETRVTDDPEAWARETVERFNATLRPGERKRELVRVEVHGAARPVEHAWHKTNLTTLMRGDRIYDTVKCDECGITGKRFGLALARRDSQFRAKVYARCYTAAEHLAGKALRGEPS